MTLVPVCVLRIFLVALESDLVGELGVCLPVRALRAYLGLCVPAP